MAVILGEDRRAQAPWKTPGEFLVAVKAATLGEGVDPRLIKASLGTDEVSVATSGWALPESHAPVMLSSPAESDPSAGRMQVVPMTTRTTHVGARVDKDHRTSVTGGLRVYRLPETDEITPSKMQTERITLYANEKIGLTFASNRIVTDSFPAFTALLETAYRDEFDASDFEERLDGSGVGEFAGVLKAPCRITIAKEGGQSAATINGDNVVKMASRCWRYGSAVWVATNDARAQIMKTTIVVEDGGSHLPLWTADADGEYLAGRPLFFHERCATLGTEGDILCANWSQYLDGTFLPMQGVSSIHVRFLANESAFRFSVSRDGAPWWRTPMQPKRSTTTLSPFITLAERS